LIDALTGNSKVVLPNSVLLQTEKKKQSPCFPVWNPSEPFPVWNPSTPDLFSHVTAAAAAAAAA
jgi:hypothetical protein